MPALMGRRQQQSRKKFFLPVCQGESSESVQTLSREKGVKSFFAGNTMHACLCIMTLLLGGIIMIYGKGECTRLNYNNERFLTTQHDNAMSAAINNCISIWQLQGRSNGATKPRRVWGIRQAMAAPPQVRVKMISRAILLNKCQKIREMINPEFGKLTIKNAQNHSNATADLFNMGMPQMHGNKGYGARDVTAENSAHAELQHQQQPTNHSSSASEVSGDAKAKGHSGSIIYGSDEPHKLSQFHTTDEDPTASMNTSIGESEDGAARDSKIEDGTSSSQRQPHT